MFFGTSITMPAMPMVMSVKANRRADSVGSHEATTDNAHQSNAIIKIGRNKSISSRAASWSQAPSAERQEQQRIADLVGEIACFRNRGGSARLGMAGRRSTDQKSRPGQLCG